MTSLVVFLKFAAIFGALLWYTRRLSRERRQRERGEDQSAIRPE